MSMPPPHIGRVALSVTSLDRAVDFYTNSIGLTLLEHERDSARLSAGDEVLLVLQEQPGAYPVRRAAGLYHFALLVPSRHDLAVTLRHLLEVDAPISGYADHAVSEAIYLTDPDGHGIEIYRDRPRSEWVYPGGDLKITVEPFDFQGVMAELESKPAEWAGLAAETMIGHIHLQVAHIPATEDFYIKLLGFDLMARYGSGASFLSANGYHHHFGLNTWAGVGLPPAPAEAAQLLWYEIRLPDAAAVKAVESRLSAAGYPFRYEGASLQISDPSGIQILVSV
ncbi:MAG: VOC family protein [Chloroflexota bacterium]|jgi:catechol 2,3-dioxygenase